MPKKNKLVKAWVNQHVTDHYVHMAAKDNYRSRAAYKLIEIDEALNLFKNVQVVVDLGCAPGSWSQYAVKKVGVNGIVIGIDLLEITPIHGLEFIHGDFTTDEILKKLVQTIDNKQVDLIISDMAPNLSGIRGVDQARGAYLIELVLDFAREYLKVGGNCIIKIFHGGEFDNLVKLARSLFNQVVIHKPSASRSASSETYMLCKNKI
jgi:23S rRNA (uridine2552-2'-O)-methyltransferase